MRQNVINDFNKGSLNNTANLVPRVCLHCLPLSLGVDEAKNGDRCPSRAMLKHTRAYTPLKFFSFSLRLQDKGYTFVWIQRIEISL